MKTTLYWTGQRLQRGVRKIRWTAQLWWFNQEIDFLAWRWRLELQLSDPEGLNLSMPHPARKRLGDAANVHG